MCATDDLIEVVVVLVAALCETGANKPGDVAFVDPYAAAPLRSLDLKQRVFAAAFDEPFVVIGCWSFPKLSAAL